MCAQLYETSMPKQVSFKVEHKPDGTAIAKVAFYALALMATRESSHGLEVAQEPDWTAAESDKDAHDEGMKIAQAKWPPSAGWQSQAAVRKVTMFIDLLKDETKGR